MSGKLLLKLEAVSYLLQHHPAEHFAFLAERGNMRMRPVFYATLARLLFMDDTPAKFHSFVAPLQQVEHAAMPCHACFGRHIQCCLITPCPFSRCAKQHCTALIAAGMLGVQNPL